MLVKHLFTVLHKEISRSNLIIALTCSITMFLGGIVPILVHLTLPKPVNVAVSTVIVVTVVGVFWFATAQKDRTCTGRQRYWKRSSL